MSGPSHRAADLAQRFALRLHGDGDVLLVERPDDEELLSHARKLAPLGRIRNRRLHRVGIGRDLLRRAMQAVCEGRDPGDLTTMEDPAALEQIKQLV